MASLATFLHKAENWWFPYFRTSVLPYYLTENGNGESDRRLPDSFEKLIHSSLSEQAKQRHRLSTYHGLVLQYAQ